MTDGLTDQDRAGIRSVLEGNRKVNRALLFGSRVLGTFRGSSDVDLALEGRDLNLQDVVSLQAQISKLNLPVEVDFVIRAKINNAELEQHIKTCGREWYRQKQKSWVMADEPVRMCPTVQDLPDGWQVKRLASFCTKIGTGATPRGGSEVYLNSRVSHALVRSQHVFDRHFDSAGLAFISDSHAKELRNAEVQSGDVLLNITGDGVTFGRACIVPDRVLPACVNQHVSIIRPDRRECDPGYLLSVLTHPATKGYIESFNSGGSRRAITKGHIESFEIPLPPLAEQKAIAAVLGALDDKIELNRRMNATLEAMARALFQSWFVDFDPVRAKLDGRKPFGLDAETAALFPVSFQNSPLGPIPRGWTAQRLPDAIEVNPHRILKGGTTAPYLEMKNLPTQGHSAEEVIDRKFSSGTKFQNGDTLLARITPCLENGKTGYVDFLEAGQVGWGSTEYIVLAPKPPLPPQFGYLLARSDALRSHAIQNMTGTSGRQRVPSECFNAFLLAVPPPEIARRFDELTAPQMAKIKANSHQSRMLASLRDTLLPKLLSGELSVADVSKELSA